MRFTVLSLGLLAALPLCSQDSGRHWYLDIHQVKPSLEGHFQGLQDGKDFSMDLKTDLALEKDKTKVGFGLEYQGPRFGLEVSRDEQDYAGSNVITKRVTINGQDWSPATRLNTSVKAITTNFNWTIRALKWPQFWVGVDLGVRAMDLDLVASGAVLVLPGTTATVTWRKTLPVPQLGLSVGFNALDGQLVGRGFYHFLSYSGATYSHVGADLRYFPITAVGVRAFLNTESFKVPKGSAGQDADIGLDRTGSGFGVVVRF